MKSRIHNPDDPTLLPSIWQAKNKGQQRAAIWRYLRAVKPSPYRRDYGSRFSETYSAFNVIWSYAYVRSNRRLSKIQVWVLICEYLLWEQKQKEESKETGPEDSEKDLKVHYRNDE